MYSVENFVFKTKNQLLVWFGDIFLNAYIFIAELIDWKLPKLRSSHTPNPPEPELRLVHNLDQKHKFKFANKCEDRFFKSNKKIYCTLHILKQIIMKML